MRARILPLLIALGGCPVAETVVDPPADDDDDATTPEPPIDGDWIGPSSGVVLYGSQGSYPCEGIGEVTVDVDERSSGVIECTYMHTGDVCTFEFEDFPVDGGPVPAPLDCFGQGEATYSVWSANGQLYGRVQRLSVDLSVEIGWTLDPAE